MPRKSKVQVETEWSFPIQADDIQSEGKQLEIAPSEAQRKALAKRLGIVRLNDLKAQVALEREKGSHTIIVRGNLKASVTQNSVVSMEPMDVEVEDEFESFFADHNAAVPFQRAKNDAYVKSGITEVPMLDEREDPEPLDDGKIDLGELVTQYLSLAIDPYPHKETESYENSEVAQEKLKIPEKLRPNPFEALKNWRPKD